MVLRISLSASPSLYKFIFLFTVLVHGALTSAKVVNIGAIIINGNSRIGKEEKIAIQIAIKEHNNVASNKYKLALYVNDSGGNPLRASAAANELIKEYKIQAIIGMETWQEAVSVAETAKQAKVPVLSFATPAVTPPLISARWPFLFRMANDDLEQMKCLASLISSYEWRKVIAIYEDDFYSTDTLVLTLLSDALRSVGSEIEHWSAFPPISSLSDPETVIREKLEKLMSIQSRVFIIVRSSLDLLTHLFPLARELELIGRDSVWITTDAITSQFDTVNSSVMQSMRGVIGIKSFFNQTNPNLKHFSDKFRSVFRSTYLEEDKFEPGIHAFRAYDAISVITRAMDKYTKNSTSSTLLHNFRASNFSGLSSEIRFKKGGLSSSSVFQIVNVYGKSYSELMFWSSESKFYADEGITRTAGNNSYPIGVLGNTVYWPGRDERIPRGWAMPTDAKPLKIGVPGKTSFEKFVKFNEKEEPTGFSIDIFREAVKAEVLGYHLPHIFERFDGTYNQLVDQLYFKKFDAVVGDITILANRSKYVDFTQPYAESGLSMIVPVKPDDKAWLFLKPFTKTMWLVTGGVFVYTMFVVWFLERKSNPDFRGPWKDQLGTALWFTFSTVFFSHRERLNSNYTRVVIVIWLFVVFVVTASYTASLTSMLTVQRIEATVTDIQTLKHTKSAVGCDGDSFVMNYLQDVLHFDPKNIKTIKNEYDYPDELSKGKIKAAFLELPYEKVFLSRYCKDYKDTGPNYRFGGLAFAFPKGSPIVSDISEAFLILSEDGTINRLEKEWFKPTSECLNSDNNMETGSLSLENFWGLFVVTGTTSTLMFILYLFMKLRSRSTSSDDSLWNRFRRLFSFPIKNEVHIPPEIPLAVQPMNDMTGYSISSSQQYLSPYTSFGHTEASPLAAIEMQETVSGTTGTRRFLNLASFPGRGRRDPGFEMDHPDWNRFPSSRNFVRLDK